MLGDALAQLRAVDDEAGIAQLLAARGGWPRCRASCDRARAALRESLAHPAASGRRARVSLSLGLLAELAAAEGDGARQRCCSAPWRWWRRSATGRRHVDAARLGARRARRRDHAELARPRLEAALAPLSEALG